MGLIDRAWEQFKLDVLPRPGRDKWDPKGAQRFGCIWLPLFFIIFVTILVVIGIISAAISAM